MPTRNSARYSRNPDTMISRSKITRAGSTLIWLTRSKAVSIKRDGRDKQFVGDRIEKAAEAGDAIAPPGEIAIEEISDGGGDEQGAAGPAGTVSVDIERGDDQGKSPEFAKSVRRLGREETIDCDGFKSWGQRGGRILARFSKAVTAGLVTGRPVDRSGAPAARVAAGCRGRSRDRPSRVLVWRRCPDAARRLASKSG